MRAVFAVFAVLLRLARALAACLRRMKGIQ
jgi:predicted small lipoprotein YifL